ncbi:Uncharacterized protein Rs2_26774 [Raphanus sativus]|nr:hypothetical protein Rs2_45114 [Raphanus sativus]KAJ4887026.1 Uncharacterized protein Rs2_26774 [Raphanus sativus]
MAMKLIQTSDKSRAALYFVDISPRLSEWGLRFSLIYFWEARNTANGGSCSSSTNQGMIDFLCNFLHGTVIYQPQLKPGSTYSLKNLFATKPKEIYRVADLRVTICFSHSSVLFHLEYLSTPTGSDSTYMKVISIEKGLCLHEQDESGKGLFSMSLKRYERHSYAEKQALCGKVFRINCISELQTLE